ncbi:MAG: Clp protease ClpP [Paludibacter sp.]|nr:Clp protease ClpP [Paludibacter sp.]
MKYRKISATHAESKLYGNIGDWWTNGDTFTSFLEELESKGFTELTLRMHCYGGSVFEGNVMANAVSRSSMKINVTIDGLAASMGCFFLPYIPKENVQIAANAFGMVHRPKWGGGGDADDLLQQAKLLQDMENNFVKTVAERTGKKEAEVRALWFDGKDHWLNADEMVQFGFAAKKVKSIAASLKELDKQVIESMDEESVYSRFAAVLDKKNNNNQNPKKMNIALWIAAFQLEGLTAESTEEAVLAAVQAKQNKLSERITNLEASAKTKMEAEINAVLEGAEGEGKFNGVPGKTKEQARAFYKELGEKSGVETLRVVVAGLQGTTRKPTIMQTVVPGATAQVVGAQTGLQTWEDYQTKNPEALQAMADENHPDHEIFRELYKAEFKVYPQ